MQFGRDDLLGVPGRVLGRQEMQPILRFRKDFVDQLSQATIKLAALWAAGFGKNEAAFVDVPP